MTPVEPPPYAGTRRIVFAEDQPEYLPLPARVDSQGRVHTVWELSEEEIFLVLEGGKIHLSILTFGQPLQPIQLEVLPVKHT